MDKQIDSNLLKQFKIIKLQGSGSYGHVWKVSDKNGKIFALKKIFDAFQNPTDAQRTYRQISALHQLKHKNIVILQRVFKAQNKKDLYLLFQWVQSDIGSLIGKNILQPIHIKFIIWQILKGLKYIHSAQLIHRDLKPICICDFGLIRSLTHQQGQKLILTQQVATRWYRSPELLLSNNYDTQTDMWSLGCILYQLLCGKPLFPGLSIPQMLQKIIQFTGIPGKAQIDQVAGRKGVQILQDVLNSSNICKKGKSHQFNNSSKQLVTLCEKMLQFNPKKRITVQMSLQLQMFQQFSKYKQNDQCLKFVNNFIDDNIKLSVQQYRKIIYSDIQRRYPQLQLPQKIKRQIKKSLTTHKSVLKLQNNDINLITARLSKINNKHSSTFHKLKRQKSCDNIILMRNQKHRSMHNLLNQNNLNLKKSTNKLLNHISFLRPVVQINLSKKNDSNKKDNSNRKTKDSSKLKHNYNSKNNKSKSKIKIKQNKKIKQKNKSIKKKQLNKLKFQKQNDINFLQLQKKK